LGGKGHFIGIGIGIEGAARAILCQAFVLPKTHEELDDCRAYDEAKAGSQDAVPFERAVHEIQEDYKP